MRDASDAEGDGSQRPSLREGCRVRKLPGGWDEN